MNDDESAQYAWRGRMSEDLASGEVPRANLALLALAYDEPDRLWLEDLLLRQLAGGTNQQLRELAWRYCRRCSR